MELQSMRDRFIQIYEVDEWQGGSGPGSFAIHTKGYRRFLQRFLRNNKIQSIVDLGCGDWQFSRFVDWGDALYQGLDLVPSVIEQNRREFSKPNVSFHLYDGDLSLLPKADLLLCKDVIQHWSNSSIESLLGNLGRFRYALITNCVNPLGVTVPSDTPDGGFRYLDIRQDPFRVKADLVYTFTNAEKKWWTPFRKPQWKKYVLLVRNGQ